MLPSDELGLGYFSVHTEKLITWECCQICFHYFENAWSEIVNPSAVADV